MITIALTLEQKRALRNKPGKRGKPSTTLPALQRLKPGEDIDFPLGGKSYSNEQSARSARSAIEKAAREAGIKGEAFDWTEPGKDGKPAQYRVTFARA